MSPTLEPERPRVSVIVPAHDAEATLGETLASLRAQALADLEAIVVDDASADGTRALAAAPTPEDARVRLLALPANLGTAAARNAGLREARGRWVLFLDADDRLDPAPRAALVAAAEADPGADGAFGGYRHATADGRLGGVVRPRLEGGPFPAAARACPLPGPPCPRPPRGRARPRRLRPGPRAGRGLGLLAAARPRRRAPRPGRDGRRGLPPARRLGDAPALAPLPRARPRGPP